MCAAAAAATTTEAAATAGIHCTYKSVAADVVFFYVR